MKKDKSKNIIIVLLIVIIIILITLVVLFATDTITFNKKVDSNDQFEDTTSENTENESSNSKDTNTMLTNDEAIAILKNDYNDAVRHIFNEAVSYCGEVSTETNSSLSLNGFTYSKSASYNSFEELENYLKNYMTDTLLKSTNYNKTITIDGNTVSSYYEQNGSLYCNGWNKGGNIYLEKYNENESSFEITNITVESFNAKINAVYYDHDNTTKTIKQINVSVIKQNDKWLLNSYEEETN